jgi:hypothetical protein
MTHQTGPVVKRGPDLDEVSAFWSLEVVDADVIVSVIEGPHSRVELYTSRTSPRELVYRADH